MKRFLVFFILGFISFEMQAQCLFPNVVYALPNDQLTLGAPDSDAGKTICYRWSSNDCNSCIKGPTDGPTLNVQMPSAGGSYHFTRKKISEDGVQACTVVVNVEECFHIVSVTPKMNCYSEGDAITESQFVIVTDPPGLEGHVRLSQNSRTAHCSNPTWHTCEQTLTFIGYNRRNEQCDSRSTNVLVYATELFSVEAPTSLLMIQSHIREAKDILEYINRTSQQISSSLSRIPGPVRFDVSKEPEIDCKIGASLGICCDGKTGQFQSSLTVSVSGRLQWWFYYPICMIPCLQIIPPNVQLEGSVGFGISGEGSITYNSCDETSLDVSLNPSLYMSGGISWGRHGDILYGSAAVFCEPSISAVWHVLPSPMNVTAHGYIKGGIDLNYAIWNSGDRTIRFTFINVQMW